MSAKEVIGTPLVVMLDKGPNEAVEKVPAGIPKFENASVREYRSKKLGLLLLYSRKDAIFSTNSDHFFGTSSKR